MLIPSQHLLPETKIELESIFERLFDSLRVSKNTSFDIHAVIRKMGEKTHLSYISCHNFNGFKDENTKT